MVTLTVVRTSNQTLADTDYVFLSRADFSILSPRGDHVYITLGGPNVYLARDNPDVASGTVALNAQQRASHSFALGSPCQVTLFREESVRGLGSIVFELKVLGESQDGRPWFSFETPLAVSVLGVLRSHILRAGQVTILRLPIFSAGSSPTEVATKYALMTATVTEMTFATDDSKEMEERKGETDYDHGMLFDATKISFVTTSESKLILDTVAGDTRPTNLFHSEFDFSRMGIGGLDAEFNKIFRRAFASRIFPPAIVRQMGIHHVRGMLLFGPPGCGKTLIARQIGKVLNAKDPKIVNGPEILGKFVGESEANIRSLFADAEEDQRTKGDRSPLHIIILDELDAICRQRGSINDSTGVRDSIVNQLLSKIDGVESLNNILLIGMTNRKDMIDDALLRPGRLELHVEISLPDEAGRLQIVNIHTRHMRENRRISQEAIDKLPELARLTKNFSGAELEGMVRSATSYAFNRTVDLEGGHVRMLDTDSLKVEWADMLRAVSEIVPAFGSNMEELTLHLGNGILDYGPRFHEVRDQLTLSITQLRESGSMRNMTVLLRGDHDTGKTALAAHIAMESGFPFARILSAESMIGLSEQQRCSKIRDLFQDSRRSPLSILILDDLERMVDYSAVGMRYSNSVLQALLVLLRSPVPPNCKLLVIGTTSSREVLDLLELSSSFRLCLDLPRISTKEEVCLVLEGLGLEIRLDVDPPPIGVKGLLAAIEMARKPDKTVNPQDLLLAITQIT